MDEANGRCVGGLSHRRTLPDGLAVRKGGKPWLHQTSHLQSATAPVACVVLAPRSSSFWRWLKRPLTQDKRRVNPIPVGFTPTPSAAALEL